MKHHPLATGHNKDFKTILSEKLLWLFFERGLFNWRRSVPRINWEKFETQQTELFIIGKNTHSVFFWQTGGGAETFRSHFEISFFLLVATLSLLLEIVSTSSVLSAGRDPS